MSRIRERSGAVGAEPREIGGFVEVLRHALPRQTALAIGIMLLGAATEWVSLLLLVPLLGVVGLDVGRGAVGRIAELTAAAFSAVHLQPTLSRVLGAYVLVVSARAFLQRWQTLTSIRLQEGLVHYLRVRLYSAIAYARWIYLARTRASDLMTSLLGQVGRVGHATFYLLGLVVGAVISAVYFLLALGVSPRMTALACACGIGLMIIQRRGTKQARQTGEQLNRHDAELVGAVSEHLAAMKTAKSYSAEARSIALFSRLSYQVFDTYQETARSSSAVQAGYQIGSVVALSGILYVAIRFMSLSGAEVILLLFLFSRLVPRFSGMQQNYNSLVNTLPSFRRVMDRLIEAEAEAEADIHSVREAIQLREGVRFERVSFSYRAGERARTIPALDLTIPARRITAIVGPSGAGKSTIADLILGLLSPAGGSILIDGLPLSPARIASWRERIGYVPQDTFLFHDTIRANLRWARPDATEPELMDALRLSAADGFVARQPAGLDTVVGDRGVLLSGGERQRLALARALLRRPALLILDEATSALDSENEERIRLAIDALDGRLTILMITHRLAAVRRAACIHVLEEGRVIESGTWEGLLAREGRFAELCSAQGISRTGRIEASARSATTALA